MAEAEAETILPKYLGYHSSYLKYSDTLTH